MSRELNKQPETCNLFKRRSHQTIQTAQRQTCNL